MNQAIRNQIGYFFMCRSLDLNSKQNSQLSEGGAKRERKEETSPDGTFCLGEEKGIYTVSIKFP